MRLLNAIKQHAGSMDVGAPVPRWGTVISANPATMTAKVSLQPEGVTTDWLPILSSSVGGGWGLVHVPPVGTPVLCLPDTGDHESYVILGATWSTQATPPSTAQGEIWLVHSTGSKIALTNDGMVTIADPSGSSVVLSNSGGITVTANANITLSAPSVSTSANLTVGTGATGTFAANGGVNVTVRDGIVTNIY
jgi:phage baseplate assembly protein V